MIRPASELHLEQGGLAGHVFLMERLTGYKPLGCPWRALHDPFVREVQSVYWALDKGNLSVLGSDPDAALVDGLGIFHGAAMAVINEELKLADQEQRRRKQGKPIDDV